GEGGGAGTCVAKECWGTGGTGGFGRFTWPEARVDRNRAKLRAASVRRRIVNPLFENVRRVRDGRQHKKIARIRQGSPVRGEKAVRSVRFVRRFASNHRAQNPGSQNLRWRNCCQVPV